MTLCIIFKQHTILFVMLVISENLLSWPLDIIVQMIMVLLIKWLRCPQIMVVFIIFLLLSYIWWLFYLNIFYFVGLTFVGIIHISLRFSWIQITVNDASWISVAFPLVSALLNIRSKGVSQVHFLEVRESAHCFLRVDWGTVT